MPLKKKKYNARFPAGRIKKIMQTDEEVGKVAQAVPVIISRTLEMFVESLLTKSLQVTHSRNSKTLSPSHLKQCILAESRFDFLRDLVKNIPDISPAEEKEAAQERWSAENSPTTNMYTDMKKSKLPMNAPATSLNNNAHSSDSSSDCELSAKNKIGLPGNGRFPGFRTHDEERSVKLQMHPIHNMNPVPSHTLTIINQPLMNQLPGLSQHRILNRPTNFYQETLRDIDEKIESPPAYSSVIQPNPEYSGTNAPKQTTSQKKTQHSEQPKLHIDLSKGFPKDLNVITGVSSAKPVFHIDLSNIALSSSSNEVVGSPFTPTLLRQSQTPIQTEPHPPFTPTLLRQPQTPTKTEPNTLKSDAPYRNTLYRSESFNQFRKGPPPLQTLKRTSSFDNSKLFTNTSSRLTTDIPMPSLKIDIINDGQSPKYHLDLSNIKFEPTSSPLTPKKRKITPNEPPALVPITPTQKTPVNLSKNAPSMQLDEDYDDL